jgi:large subunit ribosomal protein L33
MSARRAFAGTRLRVALSCTVCGTRNYKTTRPRVAGASVLTLKKYCKVCNTHTVHIEAA